MKFKYKAQVTQDTILGKQEAAENLYMLVWQRTANSGIIYIWANNEEDALIQVGFNPKFVKHTVAKIDQHEMPVEAGTEG